MHAEAQTELEAAARHHRDLIAAFEDYEPADQPEQSASIDSVVPEDGGTSAPDPGPIELSDGEGKDLLGFLQSLTAPHLRHWLQAMISESVPSSLPMDKL